MKTHQTNGGVIPIWTHGKLPDFSNTKVIAIDTETRDLSLAGNMGRGGAKGMGHVLGISYATDNGLSDYIPISHPDTMNFAIQGVRQVFNEVLTRPDVKVIMANCMYDLEWLAHAGVHVRLDNVIDIQWLEALIDSEQRSYSLDSIAKKYLPSKYQKATGYLEAEAAKVLGKYTGKVHEHLWRLPAECGVAAYAEMDAVATLEIWKKQQPAIKRDELTEVADLEHRLIPVLLQMREIGVRIDNKRLRKNTSAAQDLLLSKQRELDALAGFPVDVAKASSKVRMFEKFGLPIPQTEKGNPSFAADVLEDIDHPCCRLIGDISGVVKLLQFLDQADRFQVKGRIFAEFNPLKGEGGGTVSGRFSCTSPNLQNQPGKKNPDMGALVRTLFIPETGHVWGRRDYSQIEFRLFVDYAARLGLQRAQECLDMYLTDPTTDFHDVAAHMTGLPRTDAKTINFGLAYGMGREKLTRSLGKEPEEAAEIFDTYHKELPFLRELSYKISGKAARTGFIRTLTGRRRYFQKWECGDYNNYKEGLFDSREEAVAEFGKVKRAFTYKAMNAVVQGSAADIMKKAMVDAHEAGIFKVLHPHITVHDELCTSEPRGKEGTEAAKELKRIMEGCMQHVLKVPIVVEAERGKNWWECSPWNPR